MDYSKIIGHFEDKTILITGASGFLAKIFLEKILRIQPNVKKLFLLLRASATNSVEQRLHEEILNTQLFGVLKESNRADSYAALLRKIIPVYGDVSLEHLGVDSETRSEIWREIDIIVNSAATTKFDERYDFALAINGFGAMNVDNFARKCEKLEMLLHVSTAYVHGNGVGPLPEKAFKMGETLPGADISCLDINIEKKVAEEMLKELQHGNAGPREITRAMKNLGSERAMLHGWPNTYSFTKAIGEMLIGNLKGKTKVVILRPTIITSTYKEPFPGWIEGLRTVDSIFAAYGKGKLKFFVGDPESTLDMIPGDMVVNSMVAAIVCSSKQPRDELVVYHVGSSLRNPLKFEDMKWMMHQYLTQNPLLDNKGNPIRIKEPTTLDTMDSFHKYIAKRYMPFVNALRFMNMMFCNNLGGQYESAKQRVNHAKRLAQLYEPYLFFRGIFDDANTENMRTAIRESNTNATVLNFDPKCIQWEDYFLKTHFVGIAKYALK